jgi:TPR repeat protein
VLHLFHLASEISRVPVHRLYRYSEEVESKDAEVVTRLRKLAEKGERKRIGRQLSLSFTSRDCACMHAQVTRARCSSWASAIATVSPPASSLSRRCVLSLLSACLLNHTCTCQAVELWRAAAEKGSADAMCELAGFLLEGSGEIKQDYKKAVEVRVERRR